MDFSAVIDFLIAQGATGVLALCSIIAVGFLWRALNKREAKHDSDRDQWHKENKEMNEKFLSILQKLEDGQERLYSLYNDLAKK
jgi:hypothetical protein